MNEILIILSIVLLASCGPSQKDKENIAAGTSIAALLGLSLVTTVVSANMTPFELKVMQTRVFTAPLKEVSTAIGEMCKDLDASMFLPMGDTVTCAFTPPQPKIGMFGLKVKKGIVGKIEASLSWKDDKESTIVRLRISRYGDDSSTWIKMSQSKDATLYQTYFRSIADYMFIDAIEWSPATQE